MRYGGPLVTVLLAFATGSGHAELSLDPPTSLNTLPVAVQGIDTYGTQLGTVSFPVSCNEAASQQMERGVALLHHMTYSGAQKAFAAALEADPDCAMGYWGMAMASIHPLWPDVPTPEQLKKGWKLIGEAKARGPKTPREQAYITALEAYFKDGWKRSEEARLMSFEQGWKQVYQQFPQDLEAAAFYALAHTAIAHPEDKSYQKQREAGAIAKKILAKNPDHPGAHHYLIHAYDSPGLADQALAIARNYGKIAPQVPHALHMPTHIFTRVGRWQESIEGNRQSAAVAWKQSVSDGAISLHYPHALDYLAYAYLQGAQDKKAQEIRDQVLSLEGPFLHLNLPAIAYALAAIPARYALERQQWAEAARLQPRQPSSFPWEKRFAPYEAMTYFAKALGAARSGDPHTARKALDKLVSLGKQITPTDSNAYWAKQVEIQRMATTAWLRYEEGKPKEALRIMRKAAEEEASTEKAAVTPGEILPARELLADMLLIMGNAKEALAEYEAALKRSPNRFNSLYGAGRAAELGGNSNKAARYYQKLVEITRQAEIERERLQQAKVFLAGH